jgi:hypothetical protein
LTDDFVSRVEIEKLLAESELRSEKRFGSIEKNLTEIEAKMLMRNGPIVEELHKYGGTQIELSGRVVDIERRLALALGRGEVTEIARQVVSESTTGSRSIADFGMRIVTFGIAIGTLIFVARGGG